MDAVRFDTLRMARKLEAAGFSPGQAAGVSEAMAEALAGADVATKSDITGLEAKIERQGRDLETKIERLGMNFETKLELLRRDMTIRLGAMIIGSTGILLTAIRVLAAHP